MQNPNRIEALQTRHRAVDAQIAELMSRPAPDSLEVSRLKRKKLLIKEEIEAATRH